MDTKSLEELEEHEIYCEHNRGERPGRRTYRAIPIGKNVLILCRACYGEMLTYVLEDLKTIKIQGIR